MYVYGNKCVNECPTNSYSYNGYAMGGRSCLTCSLNVK